MAIQVMSWLLAIPLLGAATGLRSMTPMAVLCWYAYTGYLPLDEKWDQWPVKLSAAIIFTALALGELVADKLPFIPNRTSLAPFLFRILMAGMAGAMAADALNGSHSEGILLAVAGAIFGTSAGFMIRRDLVEKIGCPDWQIALAEDIFTISCAIFALHIVTS